MVDGATIGCFPNLYACSVSYTHLRAHETRHDFACRLLLEKKPGDFVFVHAEGQSLTNPWNVHHVQMYIGGGKIIEAPETGKTVRITDMREGPVSYGRFPGLK
ncbi:hypothetical protein CDFC105_43867 [Clostridioides difficile]|nr:hypothetical protein CDFC105_43867 [Clostridioides difficile]